MRVLASATMNPAPNLVLVGPMGAGKSSIGRRLAERFGLAFIDADQAIVERAGASINTIFQHGGEAAFREHECQVLAELLAGSNRLVSTGGGAVLHPDNRRHIRERSFAVYLSVGVASQLQRLERDRSRPLLARGDREQVLRELTRQREPLYREVADLVLETDDLTPIEATTRLALTLAPLWQIKELPA